MKYASTIVAGGIERVVQVLPLEMVPGFNPSAPPQEQTYGVDDEVQVNWVRREGKFYPPPESAALVPQSVTRAQFMLALLDLGLLDGIEQLIAASGDRQLQINWKERLTFERSNPLFEQVAVLLGKTAEDIDEVFILANTK